MDATKPTRLTLPIIGAALLVAALPGAEAALVYDRAAIVRGEWWRMFTGHWVHFSPSHLLYDVAALGMVGAVLEARRTRGFGLFCATAPAFIGLALLWFAPDMLRYGGLSGLTMGAVVLLCLDALKEKAWRYCAVSGLLAVTLRTFGAETTVATFAEGDVQIATLSHATGAALGVLAYGLGRIKAD